MTRRKFSDDEEQVAPPGLDRRERVIWAIQHHVGTARRYAYLQDRTGIRARHWQNVCHLVQQPTMDMVAALAQSLPYFLSWMVAGEAIGKGQLNPESETWLKELFSWWGIELP